MRKLFVSILLTFLVHLAGAQITPLLLVSGTFGASGGTTSTFNTTGADGIVVALTYYTTAGANLSDNKGNTWVQDAKSEAAASASAGVAMYHCQPPCTVGSGHTLSTTSHFCGVNMIAVSGMRTASNPFDQKNSNNTSSSTTITPGSITTTYAGALVLTAVCNFNGATPTIPTGYNSIGTYTTATAEAGGAAYKILSGTGSENGQWGNMSAGNPQVALQADYLPPATAPVANPNELMGQLW